MNWLRSLLARRREARDLAAEIEQHLQEKTEELLAAGVPLEDAALRAKREFGNVMRIREHGGDIWRWQWGEDLLQDLRFAVRQLRHARGFAAAAMLTLAVAIGANTAIFSIVNAVLLRPLPFSQPDQLLSVTPSDGRKSLGLDDFSYPNFFDFRRENRVFDRLVSFRDSTFSLTGAGQPEEVRGEIVSWDLFLLLGVQPALGRSFAANEEDRNARVVILSDPFWKTRFGANPSLVGETIELDRERYLVAGVAPPRFNFPPGGEQVHIWTPLGYDARSATVNPITGQRGARLISVIGRRKGNVTLEQARSAMDTIAATLLERYPDDNRSVPHIALLPALEELTGAVRAPLWLLSGAVGMVLLLACANLANLLLTRTTERTHEIALRAAIGAGRFRIVRQLVAEGFVLGLAGSAAGLFVSYALLRFTVPLAAESIPRIDESALDLASLGFSIALAVSVSLALGLTPAFLLRRARLSGPLQQGARSVVPSSDRFRTALIVCQIALGLILVSGSGLLFTSFLKLTSQDPGFHAAPLLTFHLNLPSTLYPRQRQIDFHSRLVDALANLPGAKAAALGMPLPLTGSQMRIRFEIEHQPVSRAERPASDVAIVSPKYFHTLGIPLLKGREFTASDDATAPPVVVVNRAFAGKFFPGQEAIGKRITPGATADNSGPRLREIVGIVGNARQSPFSRTPEPIYYLPYLQMPWCCPSVVVRASGSPLAVESSIRTLVGSMDPMLAVAKVRTARQILQESTRGPRFQSILISGFAMTGLLLAAIGLYGLLSYTVVRQTREIGLRIALGAPPHGILTAMLRKALLLALAGITIGMGGAIALSRLLGGLLYGISPRDPILLVLAVLVMIAVALLAAYLPARRAAEIDPMDALRTS